MKSTTRKLTTPACIMAITIACFTYASSTIADTWTRIYGTSPSASGNGGSDSARDIATDNNGNYYITGTYNSHLSGGWDTTNIDDIIVAKLNSFGYIVWINILSSGVPGSIVGDDEGHSIEVDNAGNVYVMGTTNGDLSGEGIVNYGSTFIAKFDSNGMQQWIHQLGRVDSFNRSTDFLNDLSVDALGNSYIVGGGYDPVTGSISNSDTVIYKYGPNGNQIGFTLYPSNEHDYATASTVDANNNLYLSGWRSNPSGGYGDAYETWVKKISAAGTLIWSTESGMLGWDRASAMTFNMATNEVIVVGNSRDIPFVLSFSPSNGSKIRTTLGNGFKYYNAVETDATGKIYITGSFGKNSVSPGNWGSDILFSQYSSTGVFLNVASVGTVDTRDMGYGIVVDAAGNYVIAGSVAGDLNGVPSNGATISSSDIVLLKNLPQ